jgi:hypothetical protein
VRRSVTSSQNSESNRLVPIAERLGLKENIVNIEISPKVVIGTL